MLNYQRVVQVRAVVSVLPSKTSEAKCVEKTSTSFALILLLTCHNMNAPIRASNLKNQHLRTSRFLLADV